MDFATECENLKKVWLLNLAIVVAETRGFVIPKYSARAARPTQSSDVGGYIRYHANVALQCMWKLTCGGHVRLIQRERKQSHWQSQDECTCHYRETSSAYEDENKGRLNANVVLPMKNDDVKYTVEMDPLIMAEHSTEEIQ